VGLHESTDLALELVRPHGDLPAPSEQIQADLDLDGGLDGLERSDETVQGLEPTQGSQGRCEVRVDVVQEPAQLADPVRALVDEHLAVRHKQADLPFGTGQRRFGQVRVPQGGAGDRGGVHRVGLARDPIGPAGLAHHPGWHADRALTPSDQVTLEVPGDVATVLDCEQALIVEGASPLEETLEPWRARLDREIGEHLARGPVHRHSGVGLLVRIDPDYDHPWSPLRT
jgi:hypothetical protein